VRIETSREGWNEPNRDCLDGLDGLDGLELREFPERLLADRFEPRVVGFFV
jgi:hypothetical protein